MDLNEFLEDQLNDAQKIILLRIKKAIAGLTIAEAKVVLRQAIIDIDDETIVVYPLSKT